MADSVTAICNLALSRLGAERIGNYETDTEDPAIQCRIHYAQARNEVLEQHDWSCALTRQNLSALSTNFTRFAYAYQLPADPVVRRPVFLVDPSTYLDLPEQEYRIEGQALYTDLTPCILKYVYQLEDTRQYSALLTKAIYLRLAAALAKPIKQSDKLELEMVAEYKLALDDAKGFDAVTRRERRASVKKWVDER